MKSPKGQKRSPGGRKEQKVQKKQPAFSQKPPPIIVPFTDILPSTMKDHKSGEEILSPSDPCRTRSGQATAAQTQDIFTACGFTLNRSASHSPLRLTHQLCALRRPILPDVGKQKDTNFRQADSYR